MSGDRATGHAGPARGDGPGPLSLAALPVHHFLERHAVDIDAPAQGVLERVAAFRPADDPLVAALMALREMPARLLGRPAAEPFGLHRFTLLANGPDERAYGLAGRFWRPDFGLHPIADAQDFARLDCAGLARLVTCFHLRPLPDGGTRLVTHTRIACPDAATRGWMRAYWLAIRPASGLIRRRMLQRVKTAAERTASTSGH